MPQIATSDVTYAELPELAAASPSSPQAVRGFTITFGNGTLTYTNGGIPLSKAKLGCPVAVKEFYMLDAGSAGGYLPKWDYANNKIRLYQNDTSATLGPLIEVATSAAVVATSLKVIVSGV